ncbi:regulatory protein RecX [Leucobacter chromiireducens]|uniref:Regulatory protein RecX n=1 Tax=Leucobacter chromiireducens subsp. chromiireducens TaxID=660067 RepID=A0ABS1SM87_9MICO|nr:regulatory protein RecX [Leucobacter chromiireducens subsp. chromiireducens]
MAVRFLPPPGEPTAGAGPDRGNLAEVIELRGMLRQRAWAEPVRDAEPAPIGKADAEADADACADVDAQVSSETEATAPAPRAMRSERTAVISALGDHLTRASELTRAVRAERVSEAGSDLPTELGTGGDEIEDEGGAGIAGESDGENGADEAAQAAHDAGVRLLARRARSSGELREELLRLEHAAHDVDVVIAEFEERLYLDDAGLARAVTEKLRDTKRASRSQIRIKLRERRLPDAVIEAAIGELDDEEEFSLLREAAVARAGKLGGLDRAVAERRLLGFLARRGWSGEPASRAVREALDGTSRGGRGGSGVRFQ